MKAPHHWPEAVDLHAPAAWWCIDFISDVHLCAQLPHTFEAWRAYLLHTPASAVFILGDLFDAWVGDDARHEGFEADAAAMFHEPHGASMAVGIMFGLRGDAGEPKIIEKLREEAFLVLLQVVKNLLHREKIRDSGALDNGFGGENLGAFP